jgi:hypothetical protein
VIRLNEDEKTRQEKRYRMKGTPIDVDLTSNEFGCAPAVEACRDKDRTREFLDVLKEMSTDKAGVWAERLDIPETLRRCPLIEQDKDLKKEFDDFIAKNVRSKKPKNVMPEQGGEKANEQE